MDTPIQLPAEVVVLEGYAGFSVVRLGTDRALAYAVGSHVFVTVFNVGLGLAAMALMRIRPRDIFGIHRPAPEQSGVAGGQRASGV